MNTMHAPFTTAGNNEHVSIYWMSESGLGVHKISAKLVEYGRQKYAQYDAAPFVKFIGKRKRTVRGFVQTYDPFLVIVRGDGPDPMPPWGNERGSGDGVTLTPMRHSGFSPNWRREADALIASIPADRIVFDGRNRA